MAIVFGDPFEALLQFQQSLESLRSSNWLQPGLSGGGSYPPFNVFRRGDDVVLVAEVPGIRKDELQIHIQGRTIRISGRKSVDYGSNVGLHRRERLSGSFDRAVTLPVEVDAEQIKAECRDGILAVYLPRAERDKPRSISIA